MIPAQAFSVDVPGTTLAGRWDVSVDTGGTFTDCLARDPSGREHRVKVLSSGALRGRILAVGGSDSWAEGPDDRRFLRIESAWGGPDDLVRGFRFRLLAASSERRVVSYDAAGKIIELDARLDRAVAAGAAFELLSPAPAPLLATRMLIGIASDAPLPPVRMRLATTRGTNALLTRSGVPPVLFVTRGFADLLAIGTQARPDLFALRIEKPPPFYDQVVEVAGRLIADGREITPLDLKELTEAAGRLVEAGHRIAAVAFLHADKNPDHEQRAAACLRRAGFKHVSCSAEIAPFIKILPRAETAVLDAYLSDVIAAYLREVLHGLGGGDLHVMTSAGGLVRAASYHAKDSLLSGPAGGITGAAQAGARSGFTRLLAFDMGGTSTDVARYDGDFEYTFEHAVGDANLVAPALAIESVASGGGSICAFDGYRLRVGPASAGASPGPACYGAGGPLTMTDVNLLLGRLDPQRFEIPIRPDASERALDSVCDAMAAAGEMRPEWETLLTGFLEIANQQMADATRRISLRRGYDPRDYALVAFGGAGPQHGLAVAGMLGVETVIIPPHPGLLSAEGLAGAVVERFAQRQVLATLAALPADLATMLSELDAQSLAGLVEEGIPLAEAHVRRRIASLRYEGQETSLDVDLDARFSAGHRMPGTGDLATLFERRYQDLFGQRPEARRIELVSLRVVASSSPPATGGRRVDARAHQPEPHRTARVWFSGKWREVGVFERASLHPGAQLKGPCLVFERYGVAVIEPGWRVALDGAGALVARRAVETSGREIGSNGRAAGCGHAAQSVPEAISLELFTHRFEAVVCEMGESLRHTAVSTNVKERLDFSCALLDEGGELIVNAPHIPVHLGSLGLCVRSVAETIPIRPGDTIVTNHPAFGGSHLPDITLVTPAHTRSGELLGYVASRAHHAELGGTLPGSMPPDATRLSEEGVVIAPRHLVRDGIADWMGIEQLLRGGPHPSRAIADNLADLRAALAANQNGRTALQALGEEHGVAAVRRYMEALKEQAERRIRAALRKRGPRRTEAREVLDDGTVIALRLDIRDDAVRIDFSGTAGVHPGNLNATPAVVRSVVLYVLRLLLEEPLPLNEGLLRAVDLKIPAGLLNPPFPADPACAPAVVGGNVETSQRLVNALVRAMGLAAASQGTMNNVLFGDQTRSYYETICGGSGAGPGFHGASAIHTHMTNTRITDVELIEHRYPVRIERFAIRAGSGGQGRFRGGDGVRREIRFLAPQELSILSQHRNVGPAGLEGGCNGMAGAQWIVRANGDEIALEAIDRCDVHPGDRLIIETPGGGGYAATAIKI